MTSLCNKWTKSKVGLFLYYTLMIWIFITVKNRYLNLSVVIKFEDSKGTHDTWYGSKWTKMSRNEVMQPTTRNNNSWPVFPY